MCGFVGVVNFNQKIERLSFLKEANNLMASRGPDDGIVSGQLLVALASTSNSLVANARVRG